MIFAASAPLIDATPVGRQAFQRYIAAFNAGDPSAFTAFYEPGAKLHLGARTLNGRQEICDFYTAMYRQVREMLSLRRTIIDDSGIAAELTATFSAHEDAPDFIVAPLRKGERITGEYLVLYGLTGGRISDVRTVRLAPAIPAN